MASPLRSRPHDGSPRPAFRRVEGSSVRPDKPLRGRASQRPRGHAGGVTWGGAEQRAATPGPGASRRAGRTCGLWGPRCPCHPAHGPRALCGSPRPAVGRPGLLKGPSASCLFSGLQLLRVSGAVGCAGRRGPRSLSPAVSAMAVVGGVRVPPTAAWTARAPGASWHAQALQGQLQAAEPASIPGTLRMTRPPVRSSSLLRVRSGADPGRLRDMALCAGRLSLAAVPRDRSSRGSRSARGSPGCIF